MLEIMESICVCYGFLVIRLTWNCLFTGSVLYVLSGGRKIHLFGFVMVACFSVLVVADQCQPAAVDPCPSSNAIGNPTLLITPRYKPIEPNIH